MNKKTIITILLALVAMAGQAQEIKKVAATPEDFMEHMALCGYEVFTFDRFQTSTRKTSRKSMRRTMPTTWSAASIVWPRPSLLVSLPFSRTPSRPSPCVLLAVMPRLVPLRHSPTVVTHPQGRHVFGEIIPNIHKPLNICSDFHLSRHFFGLVGGFFVRFS